MRRIHCCLFFVACLAIPSAAYAAITGFRFSDLDYRDPHFFVSVFGCRDVTDTPIAGFSVNGSVQTSIQTDDDSDGLLDLSFVLAFNPVDPSLSGGTLRYGSADCTAPMAGTSCTGTTLTDLVYQNQAAGSCLGILTGTVRPYTPAVTTTSAPCFVTDPATLTFNAGGLPLTLRDTRIAGTYVGSPPTAIANGLLRGFLTQTDADNTTIPASFPLIGGQKLSSVLRGGTGNCASGSDKDTHPTLGAGWWFYANFPAAAVPYSDPSTAVGNLGPGVFFGAVTPNPFGSRVTVEYSLEVASAVRLSIHDAQGRHLVDLARGIEPPGHHLVTWDGLDRSGRPAKSGVYFARVEALGRSAVRRIVLLR